MFYKRTIKESLYEVLWLKKFRNSEIVIQGYIYKIPQTKQTVKPV